MWCFTTTVFGIIGGVFRGAPTKIEDMERRKYKYISDLTDMQKGHLAWRLDNYTATGYLTAIGIAKMKYGDRPVNEVFQLSGMTEHQAKIHARKVMNFMKSV
jgi:hypothetical protein